MACSIGPGSDAGRVAGAALRQRRRPERRQAPCRRPCRGRRGRSARRGRCPEASRGRCSAPARAGCASGEALIRSPSSARGGGGLRRRGGVSTGACGGGAAFGVCVGLGLRGAAFGGARRSRVGLRRRSGDVDAFALAGEDRDRRADLHPVGAFGDQDLGDLALVDRLELHRRLVGLDLGEDVARLHLVALLDQPFGERALLHRRGKRGHLEFDGHRAVSSERPAGSKPMRRSRVKCAPKASRAACA